MASVSTESYLPESHICFRMKHLFFDLDRTLWDFETNSETALHRLYDELKLEKHLRSFNAFHTTYKKINGALWYKYGLGEISKSELRIKRFGDTLKKFGIHDVDLAKALGEGYIKISPYQTKLFPKAIETLSELQNEGFALHIITNGFKEVQYTKLEKSGIIDFFNVILCSEEVGKNKPARIVFEQALQRAGAKSNECIMIGDDYEVDIKGAENVGIQGILFDPSGKYKIGTHEWHIHALDEIPGIIPWISKTLV